MNKKALKIALGFSMFAAGVFWLYAMYILYSHNAMWIAVGWTSLSALFLIGFGLNKMRG